MKKLPKSLILILLYSLAGALLGCPTLAQVCDETKGRFIERSFSIYVLSRGKGVPDASWEVYIRIRELFHGQKANGKLIKTEETRIGIEGERRLCAEFLTEDAAYQAWKQVEEISAGVELVNLVIERCPP